MLGAVTLESAQTPNTGRLVRINEWTDICTALGGWGGAEKFCCCSTAAAELSAEYFRILSR